MVKTSKKANPNYLAKIIRINKLEHIEGADKIQIAIIDFQSVVVSKEVTYGDIMVYFPVECAINKDFLRYSNLFRDKLLNIDSESEGGFFEDKGRVKAIKLMKGTVKSVGFLLPIKTVKDFFGEFDENDYINEPFDTINGVLVCEKFIVPKKNQGLSKANKQPKVSRLIDGQVHLHKDTEKLEQNAWKISPDHMVSITYKTHGTSWWVSNVKVKKNLNWFQRMVRKLGVDIQDTEYDFVYGSRKVVKNSELKNSYHNMSIFSKIKYFLTYLAT
jgi:hypothetical protein